MGDETEYFWDDETEMYYYYDEEADAYVPYLEVEEEGGEGGEADEVDEADEADEPDESVEPDEVGEAEGTGGVEVPVAGEDYYEEKVPDVASEPYATERGEEGEWGEEVDLNSAEQHFPQRLKSRKLSFAEHGGLAGCLEIAARERKARERAGTIIMTGVQQDQLIREARQQAKESQRFGEPQAQSEALQTEAAAAAFFDPRQRGRKTTLMRFGTKDFGKGDNALASMLSRQVLAANPAAGELTEPYYQPRRNTTSGEN